MALRIVRLDFWFDYWPHDHAFKTRLMYVPIGVGDDLVEWGTGSYANQFSLAETQMAEAYRRKLAQQTDYLISAALQTPEVEISARVLQGAPKLVFYEVYPGPRTRGCYQRTSQGTHQLDVWLES